MATLALPRRRSPVRTGCSASGTSSLRIRLSSAGAWQEGGNMTGILIASLLAASTADELIARENEWSQALIAKDEAALEKILAAEYTLTTAGGVVPRAKWLDTLLHHMQPKQLEVREPQVQLYGDVALVRGRFFWHVMLDKPDPRT